MNVKFFHVLLTTRIVPKSIVLEIFQIFHFLGFSQVFLKSMYFKENKNIKTYASQNAVTTDESRYKSDDHFFKSESQKCK